MKRTDWYQVKMEKKIGKPQSCSGKRPRKRKIKGHLLANPQENLGVYPMGVYPIGVYPINCYIIPASMSVNIDHTRFCQNR